MKKALNFILKIEVTVESSCPSSREELSPREEGEVLGSPCPVLSGLSLSGGGWGSDNSRTLVFSLVPYWAFCRFRARAGCANFPGPGLGLKNRDSPKQGCQVGHFVFDTPRFGGPFSIRSNLTWVPGSSKLPLSSYSQWLPFYGSASLDPPKVQLQPISSPHLLPGATHSTPAPCLPEKGKPLISHWLLGACQDPLARKESLKPVGLAWDLGCLENC